MEIEIRDTETEKNGKVWHKQGYKYYLHREDGPAVIYHNGIEEWHYHNVWYYDINKMKMPLNLFLAYCKWEYKKNGE